MNLWADTRDLDEGQIRRWTKFMRRRPGLSAIRHRIHEPPNGGSLFPLVWPGALSSSVIGVAGLAICRSASVLPHLTIERHESRVLERLGGFSGE